MCIRDRTGLSPKELGEIYSGKYKIDDIPTTKVAYETITARRTADAALTKAGFVSEIPEGVYMRAAGPPLRTYTIPNLAEFVRKNPNGEQTLRDFGFDDAVVSATSEYNKRTGELVSYLDKGATPTGTGLSRGLGLSSGEISALGRALSELGVKPVGGSYIVAWRQLDDDRKRMVATVFDADWSKGSPISAFAKDIEKIGEMGVAGMLLTAPIQPITTPIGKQLTLKDAKAKLSQTYETELMALRDYIKPNGTFDVKKLDKDIIATPNKGEALLKQTGYKNTDDLKQSLEYYNYGSRVSAKEWTVGGLALIHI